ETELTGQARSNVIFEAGMAMGKYPDRTVLIELGELRPISDIYGRHVVRMNNSVARRQELAQRLKIAGWDVNLLGTDWHEEGDFSLFSEIINNSERMRIIGEDQPTVQLDNDELHLLEFFTESEKPVSFDDLQNTTKLDPIHLRSLLDKLVNN